GRRWPTTDRWCATAVYWWRTCFPTEWRARSRRRANRAATQAKPIRRRSAPPRRSGRGAAREGWLLAWATACGAWRKARRRRMPRLDPGINCRWLGWLGGLAATLGFPHARTGAVGAAAPGASAACSSEATLADRALVAGADVDDYRAVLADLAGDVDGRRAGIDEAAIGDADRVAIRGIALPRLGHDHHAPEPVITRTGLGPRQRGCAGKRQRHR